MATESDTSTDTRARLLKAAAELFIIHSFAGTSHQMVADELGITKAAVHYYFRTREQLLIAVMEPLLVEMLVVVDAAEATRSPRSQASAMIAGYARMVCSNPLLVTVFTYDPSVIRTVQNHPEWGPLAQRERALLAGPHEGAIGLIRANAVLTGLPYAASAAPVDMDREQVYEELVDLGHRILHLRTPKRPLR